MTPKVCPNCGADIAPNARACPKCGSDEKTGWSDKAYSNNLGLPDEEFDYNRFINEEFGAGRSKPRGVGWFWWATAVVLILLLLYLFR